MQRKEIFFWGGLLSLRRKNQRLRSKGARDIFRGGRGAEGKGPERTRRAL